MINDLKKFLHLEWPQEKTIPAIRQPHHFQTTNGFTPSTSFRRSNGSSVSDDWSKYIMWKLSEIPVNFCPIFFPHFIQTVRLFDSCRPQAEYTAKNEAYLPRLQQRNPLLRPSSWIPFRAKPMKLIPEARVDHWPWKYVLLLAFSPCATLTWS